LRSACCAVAGTEATITMTIEAGKAAAQLSTTEKVTAAINRIVKLPRKGMNRSREKEPLKVHRAAPSRFNPSLLIPSAGLIDMALR
jgi:hypothetical protein